MIQDNFLNLLCALSCIVFSADCSAIVFLHVNFKIAFTSFQILSSEYISLLQEFLGCTVTKKIEEHWSRASLRD